MHDLATIAIFRILYLGLPWQLRRERMCLACRRPRFHGEDPLEMGTDTHSSKNTRGQRYSKNTIVRIVRILFLLE